MKELKIKSDLPLKLKMHHLIFILVIVLADFSSAQYDTDPFDYSGNSSPESDSNNSYNDIIRNSTNSEESTTTIKKTKGTTTYKPVTTKVTIIEEEESKENAEGDNDNVETTTQRRRFTKRTKKTTTTTTTSTTTTTTQAPVESGEAEEPRQTEDVQVPLIAETTKQNTAKPPAHIQDCKDQSPDKSEEDRCTSTLVNYPFSVSIQRKGAHYASGALLDKRWILSVATEFYNIRESLKIFRARLGSVDCKRGGTLVPLKRVEIHPSYIYGQPNYDLAMLRMAQPVDYTDYIRPISLSNIKTKVISAKFMTTYWPRLIVRGKVLPPSAKERIKQNSMRVSTQRLVPQDKCVFHLYKQNVTLDESTLCLKPVITHHSPCMPDAGAPVVAEDGLWGITSGWISRECFHRPSPTLFCRLSNVNVRTWVDSNLLSV